MAAISDTTTLSRCLTWTQCAVRPSDCEQTPGASLRTSRAHSNEFDQPRTRTLPIPRVRHVVSFFTSVYPSDVFTRTQQDIVLPLSEPVRGVDGKLMHQIHVPKDTSVFVGIAASNTNKALWGEDAYEWKPDRWLQPLPETVMDAKIPGVYANLWVSCDLRVSQPGSDYLFQDDVLGRRTRLHVSGPTCTSAGIGAAGLQRID